MLPRRVFLSLLEYTHLEVQKVAMMFGTCEERLEMHIYLHVHNTTYVEVKIKTYKWWGNKRKPLQYQSAYVQMDYNEILVFNALNCTELNTKQTYLLEALELQ